MKSNELRGYIKSQLDTITEAYYQDAIDDAMYPHIVFDFKEIDLNDISRDDYILTVDVWHKNNQFEAEALADEVCDMFNFANLPQNEILPTFFRKRRQNLLDEDKDINHIQIRFLVENYAI